MKNTVVNPSRIPAIDIVRGITISLVVMGHTEVPSQINTIFASFRMPLFFLVSGYLLNITKHTINFNEFINSRIWRLLIPYFSACSFFYLIWLIRQNIGTSDDVYWYEPLLGIFYGNGEQLYVNIPLWFLVCLFCSEIIFIFTMKYLQKSHTLLQMAFYLSIGVLGFIISRYIHLPWGLDIAMVVQPFLFIGNKLKDYGLFSRFKFSKSLLIPILFLFLITNPINGFVDINNRMYGNLILLFYVSGICGSILMLYLSQLLGLTKILSRLFIYLGKNSINILIFHNSVFWLILLINRLLPYPIFSHWILFTILGISVSLIISYFIKKYSLTRMLFNGARPTKRIKESLIIHKAMK
ncbi:acyltransferase family protein [Bacillus pacificus]|uniref:acyltransferase family protein n=1 Tax=Bacillus cereus group TaxID=86661 RepID=UPI000935B222|nr:MULTISPECIES: acyltransferase family protein [Bacillus cereus group]ASI80506.1 hypothetical protein BA202_25800 [Bacillus cereus]MCC2484147.1 acyltransferase family protein [Bacillus pacificus]MDA1608869.1 acyltransferase family protein [Bacillus cereus group sp. TH208-1LC]MED1648970.1 acyltransferase family protein [Bacillus pacificus]HDR7486615.1 acyltransferase family protein [Bacillus pacificus]